MTNPNLNNSPILALEGNILWQFENLKNDRRDRILADVSSGILNAEIALETSACVPRTPFLKIGEHGKPEVHVQIAFLELLWGFIYSWMVIYEEGVQRPQLPDAILPTGLAPSDLLERARALRSWCKSLAHGYSPWPTQLPSPIKYLNSAEEYYGEKANVVFQHSTAFLLNHERAHAVLEHLQLMQGQNDNWALRSQLEKDADIFAFEGLVQPGLTDTDKAIESWAILSVILATFYVYKSPLQALNTTTHLPVHHRVGHLVRSLAFERDEYRYYFPFLCRLVIQDLFPDLLSSTVQFEDAEEALCDALDRLDAWATLGRTH